MLASEAFRVNSMTNPSGIIRGLRSDLPNVGEISSSSFFSQALDDDDMIQNTAGLQLAEKVEPLILTCVQILQSSASSSSSCSNNYNSNAALALKSAAAAGNLRLLAKHRSDLRALIGSSGAIPALIPLLLRSTEPEAQENAVTALLNLSLDESNTALITDAGAIRPLVYVLGAGTAVAKQNAACALLSLCAIEENRSTIGACGAIPALVSLLVEGSNRGKKDALTALYRLCSERQNKERAVRAGAVGPLVKLVREQESGTTEKAMVVLSSLAAVPEGRRVIAEEEDGIAALVEAMDQGGSTTVTRVKELAAVALVHLCSDSARNRVLLLQEGAVPPLVALSQSGSARARHKAKTLLAYLRELRHDSDSSDYWE